MWKENLADGRPAVDQRSYLRFSDPKEKPLYPLERISVNWLPLLLLSGVWQIIK
jgi:hypothetical protein